MVAGDFESESRIMICVVAFYVPLRALCVCAVVGLVDKVTRDHLVLVGDNICPEKVVYKLT